MSAPSSRVRVLLQLLRLFAVAVHGFAAVECRRRDPAPGVAVDQEAGAAEPVEVLERGQNVAPVEIDRSGPPDLAVPSATSPAHRHRRSTGGHDGAARFPRSRPSRCHRRPRPPDHEAALPARRLTVLRLLSPTRWRRCTAGLAVDQQRQPDEAVQCRKCRHHFVANVRDSGIDVGWLRLDAGRACVHGPPPLFGAAPRWRHRTYHNLPPGGRAFQWFTPALVLKRLPAQGISR